MQFMSLLPALLLPTDTTACTACWAATHARCPFLCTVPPPRATACPTLRDSAAARMGSPNGTAATDKASVHDVRSPAHAPPSFFQKEGSQHSTPLCVGDAVLLYSDAHNVMLACDGVRSSVYVPVPSVRLAVDPIVNRLGVSHTCLRSRPKHVPVCLL
jgi:hypothetical protein